MGDAGGVLLVVLLGFVFGSPKKKSASRSSSSTLSESSCSLRVNVDGRELAICRVGTKWRMFVDHELDVRPFSDLAGVLTRAVAITRPHEASRVSFSLPDGTTASIVKNAAGDAFDWTFTGAGETAPSDSGTAPTMMDAVGTVYGKYGPRFQT